MRKDQGEIDRAVATATMEARAHGATDAQIQKIAELIKAQFAAADKLNSEIPIIPD